MPILGIKLDNILAFNDFSINFSYPKKLKNSLVSDECLSDIASFRYKKINVILGSNASGKTSLIRCMWFTILFLNRKEKNILDNIVNKNNKDSYIEIDYTDEFEDKNYIYRVKMKIINNLEKVDVAYKRIALSSNSSYESLVKKLDKAKYIYKDYIVALNEINNSLGWNVALPATEASFDRIFFKNVSEEKEDEYLSIVNRVFKVLDPSIASINKSKDSDDAYVIEHDLVEKIIVQEGMPISNLDKLSSGTKYGFNIANIIYSIKNQLNGIYFIDEQFSYVNSNVEKAFISLISTILNGDEQVFITIHNPDILDLNLPFHSFYFMKKIKSDNNTNIECNCASEIENRNNVSPKTIIDNDYFGICPDVNKLLEIGE